MSDDAGQAETPSFGPITDERLGRAAFDGPAVHADRIVVTEAGGVVRIAVMESAFGGDILFRGAVAISLKSAEELSGMLAQTVKNVRARDG